MALPSSVRFEVLAEDPESRARAGLLHTPHGTVATPTFVVVATKATIKALPVWLWKEAGVQIVVANTYHLMLTPGSDHVASAGSLHSWASIPVPILTDSGGFQAFSLGVAFGRTTSKVGGREPQQVPASGEAPPATITDEGVVFHSYKDGSRILLTPERSIAVQHALGADCIVALDECTAPNAPYDYQKRAMERTHRWLVASLTAHERLAGETERRLGWRPALYGVVQGGRYEDLRRASARFVGSQSVDGVAIGGSFDASDIAGAVRWVVEELPPQKPRHLLGIGEPQDLRTAIREGVDTFDCVQPTRLARHGIAYGPAFERLNLRNARFRDDPLPLNPACRCLTCRRGLSRSYLAHLVREREMVAATYLTIHNLVALTTFVAEERQRILVRAGISL